MKILRNRPEHITECFVHVIYKVTEPDLLVGYYLYQYPVGTSLLNENCCNAFLANYGHEHEWFPISLKEMEPICQAELARTMPDFPWEESFWENEAEFKEWDKPVTLDGKIAKSIRDYTYFMKWYKSIDWELCIDEQVDLFVSEYIEEHLFKIREKWYLVFSEYNPEDGRFTTLTSISAEEAETKLRAFGKTK